jgi:hypothetical protein
LFTNAHASCPSILPGFVQAGYQYREFHCGLLKSTLEA